MVNINHLEAVTAAFTRITTPLLGQTLNPTLVRELIGKLWVTPEMQAARNSKGPELNVETLTRFLVDEQPKTRSCSDLAEKIVRKFGS